MGPRPTWQEELSNSYRDEAKTVAERSEALVNELRAETERLTIRNAELSASLAQTIQANGQVCIRPQCTHTARAMHTAGLAWAWAGFSGLAWA